MKLLFAIMVSYFSGAIPFSYLSAKFFSGKDVRKEGSGNVGATNVYRVAGKLPAAVALLLDILKGYLPLSFFKLYFPKHAFFLAIMPILGHIYSPFLKMKGGKGVATTIGVLLAIYPYSLAVMLGIWLLLFLCFKIVSVASIIAIISLPIVAIFQARAAEEIWFLSLISALIVLKHRINIQRLLKGEERRIIKS